MRLLFKRSLFTTLLLIGLGTQAQSTVPAPKPSKLPEPLIQAIQLAVTSNPDVQSKWNAFLAADGQRDAAKAAFLPQVGFAGNLAKEIRSTQSFTNAPIDNIRLAQVTLKGVLFEGFLSVNEVRRLGAAKLSRYYELLEVSETVAAEVLRAYADVVRYRELVDLAAENYAEHKRSTELVEQRANAGVGRRVDVEQANGRLALAESNLLTEVTNLHDVSARYHRVVGEIPKTNAPLLPEPFRMAALPDSAEKLLREGLQNSPTMLAAFHNVRSSHMAVLGSKASYLPQVTGQVYGSGGNNTAGVVGGTRTRAGEVTLNYNLFRGWGDRSLDKALQSQREQAGNLQIKACRAVRQTLAQAYSDIRALNEKLDYEDRHRLSTEKAREAYRQQFDIGQRTLMDLLDTQNEFFQASRSYINIRHDQATAQARTLSAMGRLLKTVGVNRADLPTPEDAGDDEEVDFSLFCEGTEIVVDTVENIKAGLNLTPPDVRPGSYVVLLPDLNNVVGAVTVEGKGGKQLLAEAQKAAQVDGGGKAFSVNADELKRDFGTVMAALPKAPERFVLYFQRGSNVLTADSKAMLPKIVERAAARPGLDLSVIGHTDTSGSEKVNEALGRARAAFVTGQLKEMGLKTDAVILESHGKRSLEVATPDQTVEQRNRRVEVILR